ERLFPPVGDVLVAVVVGRREGLGPVSLGGDGVIDPCPVVVAEGTLEGDPAGREVGAGNAAEKPVRGAVGEEVFGVVQEGAGPVPGGAEAGAAAPDQVAAQGVPGGEVEPGERAPEQLAEDAA